jgi:hypothetical protein
LNIECTFQRPTKRRGPVNRVAEEIKRLKTTHDGEPFTQSGADPSTHPLFYGMESIASYTVVKRLVTQYFLFLYPSFPFPHENLFMESLERPETHDINFLSLLAAMCALVSASFPRIARSVVVEMGDESLLENNLQGFVERCMLVALDVRGARFSFGRRYSTSDAATSLLLGVASAITNSWPQYTYYMGESDRILECIKLQKKGGEGPLGLVDSEMENRLYSALFRSTR